MAADTFTVAMGSSPTTTALMNQWTSDHLMGALVLAAAEEIMRRAEINSMMTGGVKLSVRYEAVLRDLTRAWLGACAPAGTA